MITTLTCPTCKHHFKGKVPDNARLVRCPRCKGTIAVPPPEELIPVGEVVPAEDIFVGEVVKPEDIFVGEVVEAPPPVVQQLPAAAGPDFAGLRPPACDLLRPRDFTVVGTSKGMTLWYDFRDSETGDTLGDVREIFTAGQRTLQALRVRPGQMHSVFEIVDADRERCLLRAGRARFRGAGTIEPCQVDFTDPDDRPVASFLAGKPAWGGMAVDWNVPCWILDAAGKKWAVMEGERMMKPNYTIRDRSDNQLAEVRAQSIRRRVFGARSGGDLEVTLTKRVANPAAKLVLLAAIGVYESIMEDVTLPGLK
jgi:hypothetical protein